MNEITKREYIPNSGPESQSSYEIEKKAFAVIYGANNNAGKAFAYYLMSQGFNLILIERDALTLQALED